MVPFVCAFLSLVCAAIAAPFRSYEEKVVEAVTMVFTEKGLKKIIGVKKKDGNIIDLLVLVRVPTKNCVILFAPIILLSLHACKTGYLRKTL